MDLNQLTSAIPDKALPVASAILVLVLSIFLGRFIGGLLARVVQRFASPGWELMARRFGLWGIIGLGIAEALQIMGIDLSVLLGAAGFATVAVGFAAQTSTSNLISGLFLMLENAIKVGDFIEVGTLSGEVLSIDPLSVRMRTFDNRMVRVPNELLVKSPLTNLTGFPIRRIDLVLLIPQEADLRAARAALIGLGEADPDVLQQPPPVVQVQGFEGGNARFQFSVWAIQDGWVAVRTQISLGVPAALSAVGVVLGQPRILVDSVAQAVASPDILRHDTADSGEGPV